MELERERVSKFIKKDVVPLAKTVVAIYIESLSRVHAHRKLPKTMKWFEKNCYIILLISCLIKRINEKLLNFFVIMQHH